MMKINTLTAKDKLYQQRLSTLADKPKSVYYIGKLFSEVPAVAIVGSRKATSYGQDATYRLAFELAHHGVAIVSGLALGIDGIAHRAALDAGGYTIAVVAGGLDAIHPRSHHALAERILRSGGAIMSEYPLGTPPRPYQFIARNRLVAALSDGTLITEAAAKSGSLHTAQFALDLGRAVMAVPGEISNPMARGCLNLIKAGASIAVTSEDILFAIGYQRRAAAEQQQLPMADSKEELCILQLLLDGVRDGEQLLLASKMPVAVFNQTLSMMEITGKIKPMGGNHWTIT